MKENEKKQKRMDENVLEESTMIRIKIKTMRKTVIIKKKKGSEKKAGWHKKAKRK